MDTRAATAGLILAGGRGLRVGGADKGLLPHGHQQLVDAVIARLQPQVQQLAISANRNTAAYALRQLPVLSDADPQAFDGPLAGVLAGLAFAQAAGCAWLQIAPCDNPLLPTDLCACLHAAAGAAQAAYPQTAQGPEPAHALIAVSASPAVQALWAQGERSLLRTLRSLQAVALPWPQATDFANLNHLAAGQP